MIEANTGKADAMPTKAALRQSCCDTANPTPPRPSPKARIPEAQLRNASDPPIHKGRTMTNTIGCAAADTAPSRNGTGAKT